MAEFISRGIGDLIGGTIAPLRRGVLGATRTAEALNGKYVWTPDEMPWGGLHDKATAATVPGEVYQQKFFSGQDTFFFLVVGGKLIALPMTNFGYGVSQQKVPVFGAWSHLHDTMLRGTRIVQGEFTLVFTKPNMISQLLAAVGEKQKVGAPIVHVEGRDEIKRRADLRAALWNVNDDGMAAVYTPAAMSGAKVTAYPFGEIPEPGMKPQDYAGHRAFDLLIVHGNDPNNLALAYDNWNAHTWAHSVGDHFKLLSTDHNDISGSNFDSSERVYIENVELMSSGIQYDMSGQPLQESYSFIARDVTTPAPLPAMLDNGSSSIIPFTDLLATR